MIGYGRQTIDQSDIDAVCQVLQADYLTQGPLIDQFERAIAESVGAKYAVAVSNGTAGLHIACLAAGLEAGDIGVTQPITFVASANCMRYCGLETYLVDIDSDTLFMDTSALKGFLEKKPDCKVIIPVAFAGLTGLDQEFRDIAGDRIIIQDAAHALGGKDARGHMVGNCDHADMTVFSFHPVKPITTAEGGAVVTNDETLYRKLKLFRSHGITKDLDLLQAPESERGPWYYEQQVLGYNYRLTDLQAALGLSQIARLDDFIAARRAVVEQYDCAFTDLNHIRPLQSHADYRLRSGHHIYVLDIDFKALGKSRIDVMAELRAKGVGTQVHYIPVYRQPMHQTDNIGGSQNYPASEAYYKNCLTIPCFPELTSSQIERVISAIKDLDK